MCGFAAFQSNAALLISVNKSWPHAHKYEIGSFFLQRLLFNQSPPAHLLQAEMSRSSSSYLLQLKSI